MTNPKSRQQILSRVLEIREEFRDDISLKSAKSAIEKLKRECGFVFQTEQEMFDFLITPRISWDEMRDIFMNASREEDDNDNELSITPFADLPEDVLMNWVGVAQSSNPYIESDGLLRLAEQLYRENSGVLPEPDVSHRVMQGRLN
jgi:hypothetical protein